MKKNKDNTIQTVGCHGCYWEGNCIGTNRCEYFTPLNIEPIEISEYIEDLCVRQDAYMNLADHGGD